MKKERKFIFAAILAATALVMSAGCSNTLSSDAFGEESKQVVATAEPTEPTAPEKTEEEIILESMTLEQKAAQTIVTGISGTEVDEDFKALADRGIGATILFGSNITDSEQLVALTNEIKTCSGEIPIMIGMDEEGGSVTRLPDDVQSMPSAYSVASSGDTVFCYNAGVNLGEQIKAFGLSTGFSPDLDIWSNPYNTVIGDRAYGTDAESVCTYGISALKGLMSTGTIAVGKHFPGHGDTDVDSHYGLPVVSKTLEELESMEFLPFKEAIDNGIPGIMVAHILCDQIDPEEPASLSKTMVTDILKGQLDFDGVVFTDDLTMGAISEKYTPDAAAVKALDAGCDMLLVCFGYDNANDTIDAIVEAVNNGTLSEDRLDDAVLRILKMKNQYSVGSEQILMPDIYTMNEKTAQYFI